MNAETIFSSGELNRLRELARAACAVSPKGPEGWSKCDADPMQVLAVFTALRLRPGYVLRAYQFRQRGNGNAVVWALPAAAPFPEPQECPRLADRFLAPPCPPGALADFMEAVEGDGTLWSYASASLLARELRELGALWHGIAWGTHTLLDGPPHGSVADWQWLKAPPVEWRPQVSQSDTVVTVTFYTYSGLGREAIYRHVDTFAVGRYTFVAQETCIAQGQGGYLF